MLQKVLINLKGNLENAVSGLILDAISQAAAEMGIEIKNGKKRGPEVGSKKRGRPSKKTTKIENEGISEETPVSENEKKPSRGRRKLSLKKSEENQEVDTATL